MPTPSERWAGIHMGFFNVIILPWQLVMSTFTLLCIHSNNIISTLETEALVNITDGIILWTAIISACAAHGILVIAASINQTKIEEFKYAAARLVGITIREVAALDW